MKKKLFISPLDDYVFKEIFGEQRNIENTAAFLKTLLDIPEEEYGELSVKNPGLGMIFKKGKTGAVDVKLTTKSGKIIHIELQVEKKANIKNRIQYYGARLIGDQLKWGDDYNQLNNVVSIIICDHKLLEEGTSYINIFELKNEQNKSFSNLYKLIILELPKIPDKKDRDVWPWMRFLKCEREEELDMLAYVFPELKKTIACIREMSLIEIFREIQFHRNLAKIDEKNLKAQWKEDGYTEGRAEGLTMGHAEGRIEGRAEGLAMGHTEGRAEGLAAGHAEGHAKGLAAGHADAQLEIARNLLAKGSTPEFVREITGLDIDTICNLK